MSPDTAFSFNWLRHITEDTILYNFPGLTFLRADEPGETVRVQDQAWVGSEGDCCRACCTNSLCIQAVFYPQARSGIPSCMMMFFDASVMQVPSRYSATVLSSCGMPPQAETPELATQTPPPVEASPTTPAAADGSSSKVAVLAGSIVGVCVVALFVALVGGVLLWRRKQMAPTRKPPDKSTAADWVVVTWTLPSPSGEEESQTVGEKGQPCTVAAVPNMSNHSLPTFGITESASQLALKLPHELNGTEALELQLDALHKAGALLSGRYRLGDRSGRRVGGQGVVQFATYGPGARNAVALKFYLDRGTFEAERAHLCNPALQSILPAVDNIVDNASSSITALGWPLPPFVAIEKGESLSEWQARAQSDFIQSITIINHLFLFLRTAAMHDAGIVHRDLKPANVISYPARNEWTIIDFASAARVGSAAPFACTLAYAAPEVVLALLDGAQTQVADPAVDVWSLGVVSWELLTRSRVFPPGTKDQVEQCMRGNEPLPWERSDSNTQAELRRLGFMKDSVLAMLQRDPNARISARDALISWRAWLQQETDSTIDDMSAISIASRVFADGGH